jgi:hypothetical protein
MFVAVVAVSDTAGVLSAAEAADRIVAVLS